MTFRALGVTKLAQSFDEGIANLKIISMQREPLKPNQVRVRVYAAALNYFDLLMFVGRYQYKPKLPFSPGSEFAGTIAEVGSSVKHLKVDDKVMGWGVQTGAMAEELIIDKSMLLPLPKCYSFAEGASFGVGYMTAHHGIVQRGGLKKGETLLITGAAGGMGIAAIQIGKAFGATVIAAASSDEKLELCKRQGADYVINYSKEDMKAKVEQITGGNFADVIYDVVGGKIFDECVRCIGGMGRLLVVGFASGEIPKFAVNLALVKGFSLVGVRSGAQLLLSPHLREEMLKDLLPMAEKGLLHPYIQCSVPMERAAEAFKLVAERKIIGKAVVQIRSEAKL